MTAVTITALAHTLGPQTLTSEALEQRQGLEAGFIQRRTGIVSRPVLNEGQAPSELGAGAVQGLGLKSPPDWLICATSTPERLLPPTGSSVLARLGWKGTMTLDLSAGCMGFLTGLALAQGLLQSGQARQVVVLAQEAMSRILNPADYRTNVLFGDGAGAALVEVSETGVLRLGPGVHYTDPQNSDVLQVPGGGSLEPSTPEHLAEGRQFLHMNGKAVFHFAVDILPKMVREVCERQSWEPSALDWVFPHQSNLRIIEPAAENLGLTMTHVAHHLSDHGNLSAASIPVLLSEWHAAGKLRSGQRVVMAAYGSGLAYGARAGEVV